MACLQPWHPGEPSTCSEEHVPSCTVWEAGHRKECVDAAWWQAQCGVHDQGAETGAERSWWMVRREKRLLSNSSVSPSSFWISRLVETMFVSWFVYPRFLDDLLQDSQLVIWKKLTTMDNLLLLQMPSTSSLTGVCLPQEPTNDKLLSSSILSSCRKLGGAWGMAKILGWDTYEHTGHLPTKHPMAEDRWALWPVWRPKEIQDGQRGDKGKATPQAKNGV